VVAVVAAVAAVEEATIPAAEAEDMAAEAGEAPTAETTEPLMEVAAATRRNIITLAEEVAVATLGEEEHTAGAEAMEDQARTRLTEISSPSWSPIWGTKGRPHSPRTMKSPTLQR
jgi:hypothetical protein